MSSERPIDSLDSLFENAATLELDEGIRTYAGVDGKTCVLFIARPSHRYVVAAYERGSKGDLPGERQIFFKEFDNLSSLKPFLKKIVLHPVKAYRY